MHQRYRTATAGVRVLPDGYGALMDTVLERLKGRLRLAGERHAAVCAAESNPDLSRIGGTDTLLDPMLAQSAEDARERLSRARDDLTTFHVEGTFPADLFDD